MALGSIFNIFRRGEIAVSVSGLSADGTRIKTQKILYDGELTIIPNMRGSRYLRSANETLSLDLTHGSGEAIVITKPLPGMKDMALLTVDTDQIRVTGAEPMKSKHERMKNENNGRIKSYELPPRTSVRLMVIDGASPVFRELHGFDIRRTR